MSDRSSQPLREALTFTRTHTCIHEPCGGLLTPTTTLTTLVAVSQVLQGFRKGEGKENKIENIPQCRRCGAGEIEFFYMNK